MNDLQKVKELHHLTDRELAAIINEAAGSSYSPEYIRQARNGYPPHPVNGLNWVLQLAVNTAFPELKEEAS